MRAITPKGFGAPLGMYSHGVVASAGELVVVAGQVGMGAGGQVAVASHLCGSCTRLRARDRSPPVGRSLASSRVSARAGGGGGAPGRSPASAGGVALIASTRLVGCGRNRPVAYSTAPNVVAITRARLKAPGQSRASSRVSARSVDRSRPR